jgi:muramidase (phage lysozyme)
MILSANLQAFLDTIAFSEIGAPLLAASDNGYNVLVGGTLFEGYTDHPRTLVWLPRLNLNSTAAGRYQLLARYFDAYKVTLGLSDFSPASQDVIAVQQIKECHALPLIEAGNLVAALTLCAHIWASLPGAGYAQHENRIADLENAYVNAGGTLA